MKKILLSIFLLSSLVCLNAQAKARKIKFGTVAPAGTPWADTLTQIAKRVKKESKGKLKIKNYLSGQLGGELEILNAIRRGRIQGGGLTSAALAAVIPEMDVLELPYIFESYAEADFILDNYLLKPFTKLFEAKGLILVTWAENGWRNIGHKTKSIKQPSDIKGEKIRSQESRAHLAWWKTVEAAPVAIAVPEVLSALQTGVVHGFDNTALFTLAAEWHTAIKFFTITEHIYQPAAVVYSKKFWRKMKPAQQKILMGEGNGLAAPSRIAVRALGASLIETLKETGISVYKLTNDERSVFKKKTSGVHASVIKEIGGKAQVVYDLIKKGKIAFKKSLK
ncbi:MAG: tripartite ATP-independent transporter DctP family solute receptor [Thermoproteota archaeon]|jgi:tripartite ATP-independent transporter DctP family solute receptor